MKVKIKGEWYTVVAIIRDLQGMSCIVYQSSHRLSKMDIVHLFDVEDFLYSKGPGYE